MNKTFDMYKWKNPVFETHKSPCVSIQIYPKEEDLGKAGVCLINGFEFTSAMFQNVKVLGQVGNRFIACIIEKTNSPNLNVKDLESIQTLLVLFDQHAVHERIRLETLTSGAEETIKNTLNKRLKRAQIHPPITLSVSKDDARIMKAFHTEFKRIGVEIRLNECIDDTQRLTIHSLPMCMTQGDVDENQRTEENLLKNAKDLIQEHIRHLNMTNGLSARMPLTIHKVLCSQACHGAVKFGDHLSLNICKQLMTQLFACRLPFQCAHGRPVLMPLISFKKLEKDCERADSKPNLEKISPDIFGCKESNLETT